MIWQVGMGELIRDFNKKKIIIKKSSETAQNFLSRFEPRSTKIFNQQSGQPKQSSLSTENPPNKT
jgi:hypothetical protein